MYFKKCASAEFPQTRISNANARAYTMKMWKKVAGNEYNSALMFSAKEFSSFFQKQNCKRTEPSQAWSNHHYFIYLSIISWKACIDMLRTFVFYYLTGLC